ncbi:MAG: hypothetical protein IAG10_31015 [Planctomycetaceae bacterium]|nr:hypothetical protein [Planctomycetaceae bacterium]
MKLVIADERRIVYRTGFDLTGFISEVPLDDCPEPVQKIAAEPISPTESPDTPALPHETHPDNKDVSAEQPSQPKSQLRLF